MTVTSARTSSVRFGGPTTGPLPLHVPAVQEVRPRKEHCGKPQDAARISATPTLSHSGRLTRKNGEHSLCAAFADKTKAIDVLDLCAGKLPDGLYLFVGIKRSVAEYLPHEERGQKQIAKQGSSRRTGNSPYRCSPLKTDGKLANYQVTLWNSTNEKEYSILDIRLKAGKGHAAPVATVIPQPEADVGPVQVTRDDAPPAQHAFHHTYAYAPQVQHEYMFTSAPFQLLEENQYYFPQQEFAEVQPLFGGYNDLTDMPYFRRDPLLCY